MSRVRVKTKNEVAQEKRARAQARADQGIVKSQSMAIPPSRQAKPPRLAASLSPTDMSPSVRAELIRRESPRAQQTPDAVPTLGPYFGEMVNALQHQQRQLQEQQRKLLSHYADVRWCFASRDSLSKFIEKNRLDARERVRYESQAITDVENSFDWGQWDFSSHETRSIPPNSIFVQRVDGEVARLQAEVDVFFNCQKAIDDYAKFENLNAQLIQAIANAAFEYVELCNDALAKKNAQVIQDRLKTAGIIFSSIALLIYSAQAQDFHIETNMQGAREFPLEHTLRMINANLQSAVARDARQQSAQDKENQVVLQLIKSKVVAIPELQEQFVFVEADKSKNITGIALCESGMQAHVKLKALDAQRKMATEKYAPLVFQSEPSTTGEVFYSPANLTPGSAASACVAEFSSLTKRVEAAQAILAEAETQYHAMRVEIQNDFDIVKKRIEKDSKKASDQFAIALKNLQLEISQNNVAFETIQEFQTAKQAVEEVERLINNTDNQVRNKFEELRLAFDGQAATDDPGFSNEETLRNQLSTLRAPVTVMLKTAQNLEADPVYSKAAVDFQKGEQFKKHLRFLRDVKYCDENIKGIFAAQVEGFLGGEKVDITVGDKTQSVRIPTRHARIVKWLRELDIDSMTPAQAEHALTGGFDKKNPANCGLKGFVADRGDGKRFFKQVRLGPTEEAYKAVDAIPDNMLSESMTVKDVAEKLAVVRKKYSEIEDTRPKAQYSKFVIHDEDAPRSKNAEVARVVASPRMTGA